MPIPFVEAMRDPNVRRQQKWLLRLFEELAASRFYGSVEIKVEAGRVIKVIKSQSLLPPTESLLE